MQTISKVSKLRSIIRQWKDKNLSVAFVPTMGNLHQGHLQLIEKAKDIAQKTVVSIFVNPLQFGPHEDYANYPSTLKQDSLKLIEHEVNLLFAPNVQELYADELNHTLVEVPGLSEILCGKTRPTHFRGVSTVVNKLLNLVQPTVAIFGEKDYQQLTILRKLVKDTCLPVEIISAPIVREEDGLALSSRNQYLTAEERKIAPLLYQSLQQLADKIVETKHHFAEAINQSQQQLEKYGFKVDYLTLCHRKDLHTLNEGESLDQAIILVAAYLGKTRLIDNVFL